MKLSAWRDDLDVADARLLLSILPFTTLDIVLNGQAVAAPPRPEEHPQLVTASRRS